MEIWNKKFHSAAKSGNIEVLSICLQNGVDINYQDDVGWTALMLGAYGGHLEVTQLLLNKGCKKDIQMGTGWTALMRAAFGGHLEVTGLLLGSGCKTDMKNCFGWTAFMIAAMEGYLEITRLIHQSGCTTDIKDNNGETALHMAAENNHLHITTYLVERTCISPLNKTREGKTPYDLAEARHNNNILEYLKSVTSKYAQTSKNIQETALNEDNVPTEIKSMIDKKYVALYLELLESGSEKKRDIRLVIVGEKGAGKTSLINKLFNKDITDITSTNGIEIHTVKCKANSDDGLWIKLEGSVTIEQSHKPLEQAKMDIETMPTDRSKVDFQDKEEYATLLLWDFAGDEDFYHTHQTFLSSEAIYLVVAKLNDAHEEKAQGNNEETEIHGRLLKPYKESIQNKETVEPEAEGTHLVVRDNLTDHGRTNISEVGIHQPEKVNPPGTTASEVEALRISPSNVRPPGITTSNENSEGITEYKVKGSVTIEQSHKPLEQAKMDIETMLTDRSKVDFQDKEEYATLLLWDFAGDEDFYHTHQTFLSSEAIYLVVAKLNDAHEEKAQDMFQLWMNSIHCYCKLEEQNITPETNNKESKKNKNESLEPRVVLVGSHKDKVEPSERQKIDDACSDRIDSYVNTVSEAAQHHIHDEYFISNTVMSVNDDNVFQKIRQNIIVLARNMRTWNTDYPLKFIQLEKLLHEKKKKKPIISMATIKEISLETPLPLNKEELELFLKYHHEIRALVYFEDLPNFIILDTQWLANAFKCIVTAEKFRSGPGRRLGTTKWADLHDKGILHSAVLEHIIETNKNTFKFEREHNNHILNVMEKFDIIIRPNISDKDVTRESPLYYVPCMVKARPELVNIYEMFKVERENKSAWFCFDFSFLPPHLINHLIASLSREYEIAECFDSDKTQIALFKGLAVFECKQAPSKLQKILVMTGLNLIQIQVWEFAKSAKIEKGTYKRIADFISAEIENIIGTRFKMSNVTFEQKWACGLSSTKPEGAILMNNFSKEPMTEYRCRRCNENHTFIDEWSEQQNETPSIAEVSENVPRSNPYTESSSQSQTTGTSTKVRCFFKSGMKTLSNVSAELTTASSLTGLKKEEINFAKMGMIALNILADILFDLLKQDKQNLRPRSECDITYLYSELRRINRHIPSNGWGGSWQRIQNTDIAIGDDIERIRLTRNELQHSKIFSLSDIRYNELHNIIVDVVKRFDQHNTPARLYTVHLNEMIVKSISADEVKVLQHQIKHETELEMTFEVEIEHQLNV